MLIRKYWRIHNERTTNLPSKYWKRICLLFLCWPIEKDRIRLFEWSMLCFIFILVLNVIFLCLKLIIRHYHNPKQRKIEFKVNHNTYLGSMMKYKGCNQNWKRKNLQRSDIPFWNSLQLKAGIRVIELVFCFIFTLHVRFPFLAHFIGILCKTTTSDDQILGPREPEHLTTNFSFSFKLEKRLYAISEL